MVASVDQLGSPVPSFNVQGEATINTGFGGCLSILIITVTLIYALLKFNAFYTKADPTIYGDTLKDQTEQVILKGSDVAMAFSLESFAGKVQKDDPRYIRMFAFNHVWHDDGRQVYHSIPLHKCTEDDFSQFNEVERRSKNDYERIKEVDGWTCLNWSSDRLKLFNGYLDGTEIRQEFAIIWAPCNVVFEEGGVADTIHDECIADLDQQIEYLESLAVKVLANDAGFQSSVYGPNSVDRYSTVQTIQIDNNIP